MQPVRLILVAVKNPGPACHRIIGKAARLARGLGAHLELFHVVDVPSVDALTRTGDGWFEQMQRERKRRCAYELERIATRLRKCGLKVGTAVTWNYPASDAIVRRSDRVGADLIVAERRATRHFAPSLLHATDWELLRLSPTPVLLVERGTPDYRQPVVMAAVDPSHAHAKPVTLDDEILHAGNVIAQALHGTLHAMHAYLPAPVVMPPEVLSAEAVVSDMRTEAAAAAGHQFAQLLADMEIPTEQRHLIGAPVRNAIRSAIRSTHCSIVVLGDVVRGGLKGFLIGNTAEQVLDEINCDVLVVKPQDFESHMPPSRPRMRFTVGPPMP